MMVEEISTKVLKEPSFVFNWILCSTGLYVQLENVNFFLGPQIEMCSSFKCFQIFLKSQRQNIIFNFMLLFLMVLKCSSCCLLPYMI